MNQETEVDTEKIYQIKFEYTDQAICRVRGSSEDTVLAWFSEMTEASGTRGVKIVEVSIVDSLNLDGEDDLPIPLNKTLN